MSHTPGPWKFEAGQVVAPNGYIIANVAVPYHMHNEITNANGRVLAAAAELLEALKALTSNPHIDLGDMIYQVRESEGLGWDGPAVKAWSDAITAAKAAIAKATGQQ